MSEGRQPTLFVSHPSAKAETAAHIEHALNARGVRCWIAPRDVEPGEQWDNAIRAAIARTDAMLLLFCEESDRSKQVKRELILADQAHKAIIPMRLERIEPRELSYHLADSQWIDWIEQRDEAIDRIAAKAHELGRRADDAASTEGSAPPPAHPSTTFPPASRPSYAPPPHAPPPYAPATAAPASNLRLVWLAGGGVLLLALIGLGAWLLFGRAAKVTITPEFFAGVWAETYDCAQPFRFDRSGALTAPDATQGRWEIEDGDTIVMTRPDGTSERRLVTEVVSNDQLVTSTGRAYRCFPGST